MPPEKFREPILTYDSQKGRWSGANAQFSVWMDDATFCAYVASWCDWQQWLPGRSPAERRAAPVAHCQRVSYWFRCEFKFDQRIHITYH